MTQHTDEEIAAEFRRIFTTEVYSPALDVDVEENTPALVRVAVTRMYEPIGLAFRQIGELAKFFNTLEINTDETIANQGCETCDYGSSCGFRLHIQPEPVAK